MIAFLKESGNHFVVEPSDDHLAALIARDASGAPPILTAAELGRGFRMTLRLVSRRFGVLMQMTTGKITQKSCD